MSVLCGFLVPVNQAVWWSGLEDGISRSLRDGLVIAEDVSEQFLLLKSWAGLAVTKPGEDWKLAKEDLRVAQGLCSSCVLKGKQGHCEMLAPDLASFVWGQDPNLLHSDLRLSRS